MNTNEKTGIDAILPSLEYIGEEKEELTAYLAGRNFTDRIMEHIQTTKIHTQNSLFWLLFCIFNITLLLIFGGGRTIFMEILMHFDVLSEVLFFFLGLTLTSGVIGFVLSISRN